jgi:ABC-type lipoprotein release transport system permease subunit
MSWRTAAARVCGLSVVSNKQSHVEEDLAEEIRGHLELETEDNVARGMPPEAARRAAILKFGNPALTREQAAELWTFPAVESFVQDVRFGLRLLRRSPVLTAIILLALAIGIGVSTAAFVLLDAGVLHSFPFAAADRIFSITIESRDLTGTGGASLPTVQDWRDGSTAFEALTSYTPMSVVISSDKEVEQVRAHVVSSDFFRVFPAEPVLGRTLAAADGQECVVCPALISHHYWQSHFDSSASVLGQRLVVDDKPRVIIGVLPAKFDWYWGSELFLPVPGEWQGRRAVALFAAGKLKSGTTKQQAAEQLNTITLRLAKQFPALYRDRHVELTAAREFGSKSERFILVVSFCCACLVLIVACANAASLLLARGVFRTSEVATRCALGARRIRIVRQFATETLLLAAIAGIAGVLLAAGLLSTIHHVIARDLLRDLLTPERAHIGFSALAFAAAATLCTGLLFSLGPAWYASRPYAGNSLSRAPSRRRAHHTLLSLQAAVATVLLIAGALLGKSLWRVLQMDPHFNPHELVLFGALISSRSQPQTIVQAQNDVVAEVGSLPGVQSVAFSDYYPLNCSPCYRSNFSVQGPMGVQSLVSMERVRVSEAYFSVYGMRLLAERYAKQLSIGSTVLQLAGNPTSYRVVGVVEGINEGFLDSEELPVMYVSIRQFPAPIIIGTARVSGRAEPLLPLVRERLRQLPERLPIFDVSTVKQWLDRGYFMFLRRIPVLLVAPLAAIALLLSALALYGVVSFSIAQRLHEIGVRVALGATVGQALRWIVGSTLKFVIAGILTGAAAGLVLASFYSQWLFQVKPADAFSFGGTVISVVLVSLFASWLPACRSARQLDIATLLRRE